MADHALLLVPLGGDLSDDLYKPANPKFLGAQAEAWAAQRGVDLRVLDMATNRAELEARMAEAREYRYLTIDIHGDPHEDKDGGVRGEVCAASVKYPGKYESLPPSALNLRGGKTEVLMLASCYQRADMLNRAVPKGCRVISYKTKLKSGSVNAAVRLAGALDDFTDLAVGPAALETLSRRVKAEAKGNSHRMHDWLMLDSD